MSVPMFIVPAGSIDGVNKDFTTPTPYVAGTSAAFLNGQLLMRTFDDGWIEVDPSIGLVRLKEAPVVGDTVQVFYLDMSPALPLEEINPIIGTIASEDVYLVGLMADDAMAISLVEDYGVVSGSVTEDPLYGIVDAEKDLVGTLCGVCT